MRQLVRVKNSLEPLFSWQFLYAHIRRNSWSQPLFTFFFFSFSQHRAETKHMPKSQRWNGFGADSQMGTSAYYYNLLWLSFLVYRKKKRMGDIVISQRWCMKWGNPIKCWEWGLTLNKYSRTISFHPWRLLLPETNSPRLHSVLFILLYILFLTNLTGEVTWGTLKRLRPKKWPPRIRV